jgi:hypothetical protein
MRRDADAAWTDVATTEEWTLTCLTPVPDGAYVGTGDARVLRLFRGSFAPVPGFDDVDGRDSWHAVGSRSPYVRSITKTRSDVLLANVHVGGIPRSANNGTTWKPTIDVDADVHQVRAHAVDPKVANAAAAIGLAESGDAGASWTVRTEGLHATYCRAVAFATAAVLVSASDGPFGKESALYRGSLGGGPLERCRDGLPEWLAGNVDSGCVDAARGLGTELAAFGDADGSVYVSSDAGRSWTVLARTWSGSRPSGSRHDADPGHRVGGCRRAGRDRRGHVRSSRSSRERARRRQDRPKRPHGLIPMD